MASSSAWWWRRRQPQQAIVIPQSAVQVDQAGAFLLVVGEGNKVEQRRVKLVAGHRPAVGGRNGIAPGTLVITEGAQRARPGAVVAPRQAPPSSAKRRRRADPP